MTIQSRWTVPVPEVSVPEWVFGSLRGPLADFKAYIDAENPDTRYLTISDYRLMAKRVAKGLQTAGLKPGDRVLLFSANSVYFPVICMGIMMAGAIFTGASPAFGANELAHQLKDSDAQFAIVGSSNVSVALEAASQVGFPSGRIYAFDNDIAGNGKPLSVNHWSGLMATTQEAESFDWIVPADPKTTTCCLNYSSGTTGLPKGVEITHYAYVANGESCMYLANLKSKQSGEQEGEQYASIGFMPLYHAAGQTTVVVNNPKMGISTYIMAEFNFERLLQHVQDFKITGLGAAPPVMLAFAKSPLCAKYDLSSIQEIVCGTAPLAPEIAEEAEKRLWPNGDNFIRQGWGMTEVTCAGTLWSPDDTKKTASVGEMVPNAKCRIMDGDKEVTEPYKHGELWFSSPTLFKGYWRNPKATRETVVEEGGTRWIKTGDIVYADRYGPGAKIYIVDRLKELIKVRGFQVAPSELEGILLEREDVLDAGVVGVEIMGEEVPRAYIVRTSGVTEQDVINWVQGRVAKYKWLRGGVVFVDSIPRIQSGKIMRRVLRERARREVGSPKAKLS